MGQTSPGTGNTKSAPYQRVFEDPSNVDLTEQVDQARCAASGLIVMATAADSAITWEDCSGEECALTGLSSGTILDLPFAATALVSSTTCTVIAYWHGNGNR